MSKGTLDDRAYLPVNQKYPSGRNFVLCDKMSLGGSPIVEINSLNFFNRAERDRRREKTKEDFNFIFNYKYNNNIYKLNFKDIYIFNLYIKKMRL